ncbi:MAG: glycosyltransferase family 39 protein [Nanoarchaeota archaeon]
MKHAKVLLAAILALGLVLRLMNLGSEPLWFDETWSASAALQPSLNDALHLALTYDEHPLLQHVLFYAWARLGSAEWQLRLLSVISGMAAVLFVYLIGRRLGGEMLGLLSALLVSISSIYIEFSQEFRPYMLITAIAAVSFYLLLVAKEGQKPWQWALFFASLVVGGYIEYLFALFIGVVALFMVFEWGSLKKSRKSILLFASIAFLLLLPNIFLALFQTRDQPWSFAQLSPLWRYLILPYQAYAFLLGLHAPYLAGLSLKPILVPALAIIFAFFALLFLYGLRKIKHRLLLISVMALPLLFMYVATFFRYVPLDPKRFLFLAFPLFIIIANGLCSMKKKHFSAAFILVIVIFSVSLVSYYAYLKEDWRSVVHFVDAGRKPGDAVVVAANFLVVAYDYYTEDRADVFAMPSPYFVVQQGPALQQLFQGKIQRYNASDSRITPERVSAFAQQHLGSYQRVWLVQSRQKVNDPAEKTLGYFQTHFKLEQQKIFSDGVITAFLFVR